MYSDHIVTTLVGVLVMALLVIVTSHLQVGCLEEIDEGGVSMYL